MRTFTWIAVADFDEDEHADLAVTNRDDDNITVLLGNGRGDFVRTGAFPTGDDPVPIAAADFTGDGLIDLAVAGGVNDNVAILLGDGAGGFAAAQTFPTGLAPHALVSGDFNSDGWPSNSRELIRGLNRYRFTSVHPSSVPGLEFLHVGHLG